MRTRLRLLIALIAGFLVGGRVPDAQRASPRLLVLNKEEATLAIVDPASGRVL